jgi:hypothetical protein
MTKITCYTGPMEALSTYIYNPASKSIIRFDDLNRVMYTEKFSEENATNFEQDYKKTRKEVEIDETELNTLCTAFNNLRESENELNRLSRSLISKLY